MHIPAMMVKAPIKKRDEDRTQFLKARSNKVFRLGRKTSVMVYVVGLQF